MNIRENLKAYLDGELNAAEREAVEQALSESAELREEVTFMKKISESISTYASADASAPQARPKPAKRFGLSRLQWGLAGGLVCLLGLMVIFPQFAQSKFASKGDFANSEVASSMPAKPLASAGSVAGGEAMDGVATSRAPEEMAKSKTSYGAYQPERAPATASPAPMDATPKPVVPNAQRSIIRTASMSVRVKNVMESQESLAAMATGWGGFVESSASSGSAEAAGSSATLTLRVPSNNFEVALKAIRAMGEVTNVTMSGEDVTGQRVDIESRLKTMKAERDSLREILRNTRRIGDVLEVRDRLSQVQSDIDSMESQLATLKDQSALSTITVSLQQRPDGMLEGEKGNWVEDSFGSAITAVKAIGRWFGTLAIYAVVSAPLWLPVIGIVVYLRRRGKVS